MAHRKRISRDRLVLDDDVIDRIAAAAATQNEDLDERLIALDDCVDKLSASNRQMIVRRYRDGLSVQALAAERETTPGSLAVLLHRVRAALARCVERAIAAGGAS